MVKKYYSLIYLQFFLHIFKKSAINLRISKKYCTFVGGNEKQDVTAMEQDIDNLCDVSQIKHAISYFLSEVVCNVDCVG